MCQYGPDGTVQRIPLNQTQQQPSGGKLKQRIIEKKKEEMADYMGDVKSVLALYVPPNPQKMQQAMQAGKVSLSRDAGAGLVNITFKDYAQPGDQMVVAFDPTAKKIANVNVNTYMGQAKDAVTLTVGVRKFAGRHKLRREKPYSMLRPNRSWSRPRARTTTP